MRPDNITMTQTQANDIIMAARAHWFPDEETPATDDAVEEVEEAKE